MEAEQISERDAQALDSVSDRYVVRSVLGRGADATVYLADDLEEGRPVVIKLLGESLGDRANAAIVRFRAEVAATRQLDHKNIVRVVDDGLTSDHRPYLVTEYTPGRSLAAVLRESGRLSTTRAIDVGVGIAQVLAYVHSKGIVHRDLKPSNVLIPGWPDAPDFRNPKLLDFGVAGRLEQGRTQAGMIYGTLRYMSPEQVTGVQQTASTDIYGFGLLLFEMLTGSAPAKREQDLTTLLIAIRDGISEQELKRIEPDLANLIRRCVRTNPAERPPMAEVLAELTASPHRSAEAPHAGLLSVAFELPIAAAPAPAFKPSPAQPATERTVANGPLPASAPGPRRWLLWSAMAFVGAAVLAIAMLVYFRPAQPMLIPPQSSPVGSSETAIRVFRFVGGLLLMGASIAAGFWLRSWLGSRSQVKSQAYELVFGARASTDLTATIALQLDALVSKLQTLDERILAGTVALMLNEYGSATDTKDRQAALMNVVALSEKLAVRLSPWYERYKEIIASAVAIMGGISGLMTALNSVLAHKH